MLGFPLGILSAAGAGVVSAGSYDLIQTTILDTTTASVSFSSLGTYSSTYKHLQIRYAARGNTGDTARPIIINFNGDTTSSYTSHDLFNSSTSVLSSADTSATKSLFGYMTSNSNVSSAFGAGVSDILDPFSTTKNTTFRTLSGFSATNAIIILQSGLFYKTDSITSFTLAPFTGSFLAGSRFSLYGIKG